MSTVYLEDRVGRKYDRKNLYLKELYILKDSYREETDENKKAILDKIVKLKKEKNNHPYIISLNKYLSLESDFLKSKKKKLIEYSAENKGKYSVKVLSLMYKLEDAKLDNSFYDKYVELTYDAQFKFEVSKVKLEELVPFIKIYSGIEKEVETIRADLKTTNIDKTQSERINLKELKQSQKAIQKDRVADLKSKYRNRTISKEANKAAISEMKRGFREERNVQSLRIPKKGLKALLKNKRFELRSTYKKLLNIMNGNISNVRRTTPIESIKNNKVIPYVAMLFPGVGQFIFGQKKKAILFFLLAFFVYYIAIPYALGYGNYKGDGLNGFIHLGEGMNRLVGSVIFMIEAIVALVLSIAAILAIYVNYRDLKKVETELSKGIRPNNWYETKKKILVDGFPFMVSLPAFITIIFIVIIPITTTLLISFTDYKDTNRFQWVGFENYVKIFSGEGVAGAAFMPILLWTLVWTLVATTLAILIGFGLALLLNNDRIKGKKFFRTIYLLPWAVPAFVTILFFSLMLAPDGELSKIIGIATVKTNMNYTRIALILMQGWLGSSYVFILSTGVLQGIPNDLYEAAHIDGASAWKKLRRITLPLVLFQTAPLLIGQYTFNFNNFSIIYLFNGGGPSNIDIYGNKAGSSDLLISYIYKLTMESPKFVAIGAAITILISSGLIIFAFIGFKNSKAFKEDKL